MLPASVPFADAVFNLSRLSMLPKALELGDEELISREGYYREIYDLQR